MSRAEGSMRAQVIRKPETLREMLDLLAEFLVGPHGWSLWFILTALRASDRKDQRDLKPFLTEPIRRIVMGRYSNALPAGVTSPRIPGKLLIPPREFLHTLYDDGDHYLQHAGDAFLALMREGIPLPDPSWLDSSDLVDENGVAWSRYYGCIECGARMDLTDDHGEPKYSDPEEGLADPEWHEEECPAKRVIRRWILDREHAFTVLMETQRILVRLQRREA